MSRALIDLLRFAKADAPPNTNSAANGAVIGNSSDPSILKRRQHVRAVSGLVLRDRRDRDLVRRQPERKHAAMVF